jgi:hydrogenase maturation protease
MTRESFATTYTAPILVLGLGCSEAGDAGLGSILLDELEQRYRYAGGFIEFVDGGTEGLELLSCFPGRQAIVVLDALAIGGAPGAVSVLEGSEVLRYATGNSAIAHQGDAHELLATAAFLGDLPTSFYVVGVQAGDRCVGPKLSGPVRNGIKVATEKAQEIIDHWLVELAEPVQA